MIADGKDKFWGGVCKFLSTPVAIVAAVANGYYEPVSGEGTFNEGADEAAGKVVDAADEFGQKHGIAITGALITGVVGVLGCNAIDMGISHIRN